MELTRQILKMLTEEMMAMMIKVSDNCNSDLKKVIFLLFIFSATQINAQKKDFGAWYSLSAQYDITKRIQLNISEELRTTSNASETDQIFTDAGISFKLNKYVSVGGYYRFIKKREDNNLFYSRNRFYGELNLECPLKRFEISYRFRVQRQVNEFSEYAYNPPVIYNRHKFELKYNIKGSKITPSLFYERFYRTNHIKAYYADNARYGFGLDYRFNKNHKVGIGYLIDKDLYPENKYLNVITLNYRFSFK